MLLLLTSILAFGMSVAICADWASVNRKRTSPSRADGMNVYSHVSSAVLSAVVGGLAATTAVVLLLT